MKKSFTVVELLMAVALTIVIGTLVSMAFNNTQLASRRLTSTLDYQIKGRAIMDLLAQDLRNSTSAESLGAGTISPSLSSTAISTYPNGPLTAAPVLIKPYDISDTVTSSDSEYQRALTLKSFLPIQNTHYQETPGPTVANNKDGYYVKSLVDVGWYYVWYRAGSSPTKNDFTQLYRYVTSPEQARTTPVVRGTAVPFLFTTSPASTDNILTRQNVLTLNDIRNFEIIPWVNTATTKTTAYQIKFVLTNAPASEKDNDNTSAADGGDVTGTPLEYIDKKFEAEQLGYVWVEFERIVPVAPY